MDRPVIRSAGPSEPESGGEVDWSAFDLLPTVVIVADRECRCRYANPAALRWLGKPDRSQVLGRSGQELLPAHLWEANLPHAQAALAGERRQIFRTFTDAGGRTKHAQAAYGPYRVGGQVVGLVIQIIDVTARVEDEAESRRQAEEEAILRERERVAEEATTLISRPLFAATLELSATLQGASRAHADRVRAAIRDIDAAVAELRALMVGAEGPTGAERTPEDAAQSAAATAELVAANVGDVISTADPKGRYEWISPSSVLVTGWAPPDLLGTSVFDLVHPDDEPLFRARWAEQNVGAPPVGVEYRRRRPDGSYQWVESLIRPLPGPDGRGTGTIKSTRDVSERHRLQDELSEALETFELSFAAAPIGKGLVAADGRWLKVNPALSAITGRTQAELLAGTFQEITHPDDLDADLHLVGALLRGERDGYQMEKRYLRPDGSPVWVQLNVAAARHNDGEFRFFIVQVQDISRRKADAEALRHRADHDPLTGLWNRRRLADELAACYGPGRRATDRPVLLVLDLDDFKTINDTEGHGAGDTHLCDVAALLRDAVRAGDGCSRLGGDEFAVLLADADAATAAAIAGRIAERVTALGRGTVSIGTAAWSQELDVDRWLSAADRAMYRDKSRHAPARRSRSGMTSREAGAAGPGSLEKVPANA